MDPRIGEKLEEIIRRLDAMYGRKMIEEESPAVAAKDLQSGEEEIVDEHVGNHRSEVADDEWIEVPIFTGNNLNQWIIKMEEILIFHQVPEIQWVNFADAYVEGIAKDWVRLHLAQVSWWSWAEFTDAMSVEFNGREPKDGEDVAGCCTSVSLPQLESAMDTMMLTEDEEPAEIRETCVQNSGETQMLSANSILDYSSIMGSLFVIPTIKGSHLLLTSTMQESTMFRYNLSPHTHELFEQITIRVDRGFPIVPVQYRDTVLVFQMALCLANQIQYYQFVVIKWVVFIMSRYRKICVQLGVIVFVNYWWEIDKFLSCIPTQDTLFICSYELRIPASSNLTFTMLGKVVSAVCDQFLVSWVPVTVQRMNNPIVMGKSPEEAMPIIGEKNRNELDFYYGKMGGLLVVKVDSKVLDVMYEKEDVRFLTQLVPNIGGSMSYTDIDWGITGFKWYAWTRIHIVWNPGDRIFCINPLHVLHECILTQFKGCFLLEFAAMMDKVVSVSGDAYQFLSINTSCKESGMIVSTILAVTDAWWGYCERTLKFIREEYGAALYSCCLMSLQSPQPAILHPCRHASVLSSCNTLYITSYVEVLVCITECLHHRVVCSRHRERVAGPRLGFGIRCIILSTDECSLAFYSRHFIGDRSAYDFKGVQIDDSSHLFQISVTPTKSSLFLHSYELIKDGIKDITRSTDEFQCLVLLDVAVILADVNLRNAHKMRALWYTMGKEKDSTVLRFGHTLIFLQVSSVSIRVSSEIPELLVDKVDTVVREETGCERQLVTMVCVSVGDRQSQVLSLFGEEKNRAISVSMFRIEDSETGESTWELIQDDEDKQSDWSIGVHLRQCLPQTGVVSHYWPEPPILNYEPDGNDVEFTTLILPSGRLLVRRNSHLETHISARLRVAVMIQIDRDWHQSDIVNLPCKFIETDRVVAEFNARGSILNFQQQQSAYGLSLSLSDQGYAEEQMTWSPNAILDVCTVLDIYVQVFLGPLSSGTHQEELRVAAKILTELLPVYKEVLFRLTNLIKFYSCYAMKMITYCDTRRLIVGSAMRVNFASRDKVHRRDTAKRKTVSALDRNASGSQEDRLAVVGHVTSQAFLLTLWIIAWLTVAYNKHHYDIIRLAVLLSLHQVQYSSSLVTMTLALLIWLIAWADLSVLCCLSVSMCMVEDRFSDDILVMKDTYSGHKGSNKLIPHGVADLGSILSDEEGRKCVADGGSSMDARQGMQFGKSRIPSLRTRMLSRPGYCHDPGPVSISSMRTWMLSTTGHYHELD